MPLLVNLRQLARHDVAVKGQVAVPELDIDTLDAMLQVNDPLDYDLTIQLSGNEILVRGQLRLVLDCQCVRCLKAFRHEILLSGPLLCLSLHGQEAVAILNDCVDLTPYLREDILLAFPQHPICGLDCPGVPPDSGENAGNPRCETRIEQSSTVWIELNKLKF